MLLWRAGLPCMRHIGNATADLDGFVKSSSAALRFTVKGLNVQKVRLTLSRFARLACETFYKASAMFMNELEVAQSR